MHALHAYMHTCARVQKHQRARGTKKKVDLSESKELLESAVYVQEIDVLRVCFFVLSLSVLSLLLLLKLKRVKANRAITDLVSGFM